MTSTIHSQREESGKRRVVFSHAHEGRTWGPFVEDRPLVEDATAFLSQRQASVEAELNAPDPYVMMQQVLDSQIGDGTYDALRRALKDIGGELVELSGASVVQMSVTYPTATLPENVELALRSRVDGEKGAGTLDSIKAVLRGMGMSSVKIQRKSEVTL